MITKTKKNVLIVLLALLFVVSMGAIGFMTVSAETTDVTLKGVGIGVNNGAKFVLATEDGTAIDVAADAIGQQNSIAKDTENSYFDKMVFNLTNASCPDFIDRQYTFEELFDKNPNWNLHIGYDSIDGDRSTLFFNPNSAYSWAEGDRITLLAGLHVMNVVNGELTYTDYVLSENVTAVYENETFRVLEDDEAYSVTLSSESEAIGPEQTVQLTADVIESIKDTPLTVEWSSSDPEIATVDQNGLVTGVSEGFATITATVGGKSASCEIIVADGTIIQLSQTSAEVEVDGDDFTITARVNDASTITWELSEEGIVSLDTTTGDTVVVTPEGIGTVTLTASTSGGETEETATCTITVGLSETSISIGVGDTYTVSAGTTQGVTWTTSDEAVATVSQEGVITAVGDGDATVTATAGQQSASVDVNVFTYTEVAFTGATAGGTNNNEIHISGYGAGLGNSYTNFEGQKNDSAFASFFDNFRIDGYTLAELNSQDGYENWNVNIHFFDTYISIALFDSSNENAHLTIPVGTEFTFEQGCVLPTKESNQWVLSQSRVAQDTTYTRLADNSYALVVDAGGPAHVEDLGDLTYEDDGYYVLDVTIDVCANEGETRQPASDTYTLNYLLFNGYSVAEINAANSDVNDGSAIEVYYSYKRVIFNIYDGIVMDGEPLIDTEGHSTYFTVKEGYTTPTGYVFGEDYTKYYYGGQLQWWSDAYTGKPESPQTMEIASISEIDMDDNGNMALTVTFTEDVFSPTVHVNGVPSWQYTTPYADEIDSQLTTGVKEAVWYGILIDGKTVYEYMFESGQGNATNQSTAVAVHFDTANQLRITFQGDLDAGFDTSAASHTIAFDADVFYSNTGATFAMDTLWSYDVATSTWTDETAISGIAFENETASVEVGGTVTVIATVTGGTAADTSVTYTSSDTNIATVDANGVVTGVAAGTVTITATAADGSTAACTVTVTAAEDPGDNTGDDNTGAAEDNGGGCSGSMAAGMGIFAAVLLGGAVVAAVLVKRKN